MRRPIPRSGLRVLWDNQREEPVACPIDWMRERGLSMVMVETGGDRGHAPSRATCEAAGFERYPVARYFRKL